MKIEISDDITLFLNPVCSRIESREVPAPILLLAHEVEALKMALNENFKLDSKGYVMIS